MNFRIQTNILLLIFGIAFMSCSKKTLDPLSSTNTVKEEVVEEVKEMASEEFHAYLETDLLGVEVVDSTGEMAEMADFFATMMGDKAKSKTMIKGDKLMEYETDVAGALTKFSIMDLKTRMKESFDELDMEKVYTVYDKRGPGDGPSQEDMVVSYDNTITKIHGFDCKSLSMIDGEKKMEVIMYYTEEIPMEDLSGYHEDLGKGYPLMINLIMGGVKTSVGVKEYSQTLPNPEFFKVDKTQYREIPNEEFPKPKALF